MSAKSEEQGNDKMPLQNQDAASVDLGVHIADDEPHSVLDGMDTKFSALAIDTVDAGDNYSVEYYRKLLWKIDLYLLPLMWVCYGTQQADKLAVSTQAVFGIREDTHLVGDQFNWLTTVFYLSYLVCEAPANWLLQKCNTAKFLSIVMFLWGVVVLCTAFCHNFAQLVSLRALQGAFECTISPTFMLLTGTWYTSQEHTLRSIIWGTSNAGMNVITSLINYGIGLHAQKDPGGLAAWKGISFFLGALTITCSILVWFVLGTPREVRWLTDDQKRAAIARVAGNKTGSDREKRSEWKWDQVKTACLDPQTYFFFIVTIVNTLPSGANNTFSKLIWQSFGFSSLDTLLKGSTPYYCLSVIYFIIIGLVTRRWPNVRSLIMMFTLVPSFAGMLALSQLPTDRMRWTRWAMYMLSVFATINGLMIWTLLPSNIAGKTKKTVTASVLFIAFCVGNSIGTQIMRPQDAPKYVAGITACGVLYVVEFVLIGLWRFYYIWQNKKRARIIADMGISPEESERLGKLNAEADMTDRENIHFVYQY